MRLNIFVTFCLSLITVMLGACGNSQEAEDATTTAMAAEVFATLTAQTPTKTPTPSATPPPSPTHTLLPTSTASSISDNPLMQTWDIECFTKGCLMFLDIPHGSLDQPEFLTIAVAISRDTKDVEYFAFIVPEEADETFGLVLVFADSEKSPSGEWEVVMAEDTFRILPYEDCKNSVCTARVIGGIIPATDEHLEIDLLEEFLNHRLVFFLYLLPGDEMRASTTLSGFQSQYTEVIEEELK